jgi:F420-0:gamma-glutamyl ligase
MSAAGCKPSKTGVISMGVRCPIIRRGDDLRKGVVEWVIDALEENSMWFGNKDVICITESIVARAQGNYVTVDDIVEFLRSHNYSKRLELYLPIMSRNRFSIILKAFARYADGINLEIDGDLDEQGNPTFEVNQFTGVNILDYYREICKSENCAMTVNNPYVCDYSYIDCRCHPDNPSHISGYPRTLASIMTEPIMHADGTMSGFNKEFGLLGSNKADNETLKLFPRDCDVLCRQIQYDIKSKYDKDVEVLVYGDGCFKDPVGGIWEFADPVTCPGFTSGLIGTPNELKLKALADGKFAHLNGDDLATSVRIEIREKEANLVGNMASQGTTPRRYIDLLASLADLCSGSGDKGTPVIVIKNYFKNYASQ